MSYIRNASNSKTIIILNLPTFHIEQKERRHPRPLNQITSGQQPARIGLARTSTRCKRHAVLSHAETPDTVRRVLPSRSARRKEHPHPPNRITHGQQPARLGLALDFNALQTSRRSRPRRNARHRAPRPNIPITQKHLRNHQHNTKRFGINFR